MALGSAFEVGDKVRIGKEHLDMLSTTRKVWEKRFKVTKVFTPAGNDEVWARLDRDGGIWPVRMLVLVEPNEA